MTEAIWFSTLSGLSTFLGAVVVMMFRRFSRSFIAFSLGLSAVVMVLVAFLDLLPTAFQTGGSWAHLCFGFAGGLLLMIMVHRVFSFDHGGEKEGQTDDSLQRLGLFLAIAIIAHNTPEGAAIGIGFGTERELGIKLSLAMVIHNIPEGIGLTAPLLASGRSPGSVAAIMLLSGSALPLGTWLGMRYLFHSPDVVAAGLLFAATTMVWVVIQEMFPHAFQIRWKAAWSGIGAGILLILLIHGI